MSMTVKIANSFQMKMKGEFVMMDFHCIFVSYLAQDLVRHEIYVDMNKRNFHQNYSEIH